MKIVTWNVNSLRVRLPSVLSLLKDYQPDLLALQEIKMKDELFPIEEFNEAGYYSSFSGEPGYNGVAFLSSEKIKDIQAGNPLYPEDQQKRILSGTLCSTRIINLYVPNGQSIDSEKYQYKLEWLYKLKDWMKNEKDQYEHMILLGDFNIAPQDIDVHDPELWKDRVLCSQRERTVFNELLNLGFYDSFRQLYRKETMYTWWDYRMMSFRRNKGLRIDHILHSSGLKTKDIQILKTFREESRPSDHAPVFAYIDDHRDT